MARFRYLKGDSFFHKMDPTWKFIWNFAVIVAVIANFNLSYTALWYVYLLFVVFFLAKISVKQYLRSMLPFFVLALFIAFWKSVYYAWEDYEQVHLLFSWGPINVTQEGVLEGFVSFFRVLAVVTTSIVFTLTTDPAKMVESLIQVAKLPYRIGYTAYAALRFLPIYENEAQIIINAHQIRGVGEPGKNLGSRLKLYKSLLVPLLVSGIRRAQAASIAMDSRAFGAYDKRTHLYDVKVSRADIAFTVAHIVIALSALFYFVILGRGIQYLG